MSGRDGDTLEIRGRARRLGDRVDTDAIIASVRKKETLDPHELKRWLLETLDPGWAASVRPGDVVVAGEAFGCGSAMEVAVTVPMAAGIQAVVARSFSRTYFRNAVNNGLLPVTCDTAAFSEGDPVLVRVAPQGVRVTNETTGAVVVGECLPPFVLGIVRAGGLVPYLRERGGFGGEDR